MDLYKIHSGFVPVSFSDILESFAFRSPESESSEREVAEPLLSEAESELVPELEGRCRNVFFGGRFDALTCFDLLLEELVSVFRFCACRPDRRSSLTSLTFWSALDDLS